MSGTVLSKFYSSGMINPCSLGIIFWEGQSYLVTCPFSLVAFSTLLDAIPVRIQVITNIWYCQCLSYSADSVLSLRQVVALRVMIWHLAFILPLFEKYIIV